jgi:pyridoxine/pyridoxamine 5'-phosphate oxidase
MDWLYTRRLPQSSIIASREALLHELETLELPEPLTAPHTASGFYLAPQVIDRLDLGMANGIHDRRRYRLGNPSWSEEVLVP